MLKTNLVNLDRALRSGAGLFLLATPILELETYPYNLFGALLVATGIVGFCPLVAIARTIVPTRRSVAPSGTHGFGQLGDPHGPPAH